MMAGPSARMEIEESKAREERDEEIKKLFMVMEIIIDKVGAINKSKIGKDLEIFNVDLDTSDEIAGVLMTVFTCLRKEEYDPIGYKKYLDYMAKVRGVDISIQSVVEDVKNKSIKLNFLVATPIVELLTLFKSFFDEVRTGVTRFRVRSSMAKKSVKRDSSGNGQS